MGEYLARQIQPVRGSNPSDPRAIAVTIDPQIRAREAFLPQRTERGTFLSPTFLPQMTRRTHRRRAPRHVEHTRAVLLSLGYSKARILKLRDTGVIQ